MRGLLLAVLLPACGFTAPLPDDPAGQTEPPPHGGPMPTTARHCTPDPDLRLCIDFDDDQALSSDGSGRGHDAVYSDIAVMPRAQEQAVALTEDSRLTVPESPDLDITGNFTAMAWARPADRPDSGESYWVLDNNRQYSMSYQSNGKFRCALDTTTVDSSLGVPSDAWYHVACTYDPSARSLRIYVNGMLAGCRSVQGQIPTDGQEGLAIGSNINAGPSFSDAFVGGIDNVEVYARTFTQSQVCDVTGSDSCKFADFCP